MDYNARKEMDSIIYKLSRIAQELDSISYEINYEFKGIGNNICASCLEEMACSYRHIKNELHNLEQD